MDKTIIHIDMDSYFASVEQQINPSLRNKPVAVTGGDRIKRTVLAAASYQAKKFGVKTGMTIKQAKTLCPNLILIQSDCCKYFEVSKKLFKIFKNFSPLMEIFSIDEVFLDITSTSHLFSSPFSLAQNIKKKVKNQLGPYLTCSIGISHNKLLAKLASGLNKPDKITTITQNQLPYILDSISLDTLCGIGPRIKQRLNTLGIYNFLQLRQIPKSILFAEFGNFLTSRLKNLAYGIDNSPLLLHYQKEKIKSISHRQTLEKDITNTDQIKGLLFKISQIIGKNLRSKSLSAKTVFLNLRTTDLTSNQQQKTLSYYTNTDLVIFKTALSIFKDLNWHLPIRMVGLSVSNLTPTSYLTPSIFEKERKKEKINKIIDKINDKFGLFTIQPATTLTYPPFTRRLSSFASSLEFTI